MTPPTIRTCAPGSWLTWPKRPGPAAPQGRPKSRTQALPQRKGLTLPQLLDAWRNSPYRDVAFRNYLAHEIGGRELGRPDDVRDALLPAALTLRNVIGTGRSGLV